MFHCYMIVYVAKTDTNKLTTLTCGVNINSNINSIFVVIQVFHRLNDRI